MLTKYGHLTYCTNIHGGESWEAHFALLKKHFPQIKHQVSPDKPMGLGLRLSDKASKDLLLESNFVEFRQWLDKQDAYIFTMNGFPFGDFHEDVVKENVHTPDWTTTARLEYTNRLFDILAQLLPDGLDGGVSTSPLAYRHHYLERQAAWSEMRVQATQNIVEVALHLIGIAEEQGKVLHLDIEPEPDGVLENGPEFIDWYQDELLPMGASILSERLGMDKEDAQEAIRKHIRLCYDVCHFALGYENHGDVVGQLAELGIQIGKLQISAAIKSELGADYQKRETIGKAFMAFDERVYLHQVIAKQQNGSLVRYKDLPDAQSQVQDPDAVEWRAHFHVPIFLENMGELQSTQSDIVDVLSLQRTMKLTLHLEVETYTWGVLPEDLQLPIADSISRELDWVNKQLN